MCHTLKLLHILLLQLNKCSLETKYMLHYKKKSMYKCMYIHYGGISHSSIIKTVLNFAWKAGIHLQYSAKVISVCKHHPHNQELTGELYIRDSVDPSFIFTSLDIFFLICIFLISIQNKEVYFQTNRQSNFIHLYQLSPSVICISKHGFLA